MQCNAIQFYSNYFQVDFYMKKCVDRVKCCLLRSVYELVASVLKRKPLTKYLTYLLEMSTFDNNPQ